MGQILYYLPCSLSLIWFFTYLFKVKNTRQKLFTVMLALQVFYYINYALYLSPQVDYLTMMKLDVINEPLILALLATYVSYLLMLRYDLRLTSRLLPLYLPAVVYATVISLIEYVIGFDNAAEYARLLETGATLPEQYQTPLYNLFFIFEFPLLSILSLLFFGVCITICVSVLKCDHYSIGDIFRFFFRGGISTPRRSIAILFIFCFLTLLPLATLGRNFMIQHTTLGIILTLLLSIGNYCFYFVEYHSNGRSTVTLHQLSHIIAEGQEPYAPTIVQAAETSGSTAEAEAADLPRISPKMEQLAHRLRQLIEEEELWRNDELNIQMLTERLDVSRATLSSLINTIYGKPFRDVINTYRIEAVKQLLLADPTTKQSAIAYECGFKNASYLNAKFKEIVGEAPHLWLANQAMRVRNEE